MGPFDFGGCKNTASAESARQALLLATQALGVNAAAVREAEDLSSWALNRCLKHRGADDLLADAAKDGKEHAFRHALCRHKEGPRPALGIPSAPARSPAGTHVNDSCTTSARAPTSSPGMDAFEIGGGANTASAENARQALLLATQALGVNAAAVCYAKDLFSWALDWLLKHRGADDLLADAAKDGKAHALCHALSHGADKIKADKGGWSALMCAAQYGRTDCVRLLLEAGADKDKANEYGNTALIDAACKGHTDCVRVLLEAGADRIATLL